MNAVYMIMGLEIFIVLMVSIFLMSKIYTNYFSRKNEKDPFDAFVGKKPKKGL